MKGKGILAILIILILLSAITLIGCTASNSSNDLEAQLQEKTALINQLKAENEALLAEVAELQLALNSQQQNSLLMTALTVIGLLKDQDMEGVASYVHPLAGVRFSPYTYVDLQNDLVFSAQQVETLMQNTQTYNWGSFDGTGDPIIFTFNDYFARFIYDQDFANPHMIGNNIEIGTSSMINNISQAYPNGMFVEFHFTGFDPQYMGMDWRSLRLVFEDVNGSWYLVGIVHDEWTT